MALSRTDTRFSLFINTVLFHISEEHGLLSRLLIKKEIHLPNELISEIINRILSL